MESVLDPIKKLLSDRKQVEKELKRIEQQYEKAIEKARGELRGTILKLCAQAGTTLEEVFGGVFPSSAEKATRAPRGEKKAAAKPKRAAKKGAARKVGPGKYILKGKEIDGRKARAVKGFDPVRVDGKIDDAKAIAAKMINPAWLASGGPVVKRFVQEYKLDVAAYSAK